MNRSGILFLISAPSGGGLPSLTKINLADILAASRRSGIPSRTPGGWPR